MDGGGREGRWNWMQTVSCVFIQTVFVLFSKRSGDEGGGGRVSTNRQRERKVKANSPTQCDQSELFED